jgi:uncharacterized DUF497 family protein
MEIVWDERKRQRNIAKHGLDFAVLSLDFFLTARVLPAMHDRFLAIGELDGRMLVAVVFRPLGTEAIAMISMRRASRRERSRTDD